MLLLSDGDSIANGIATILPLCENGNVGMIGLFDTIYADCGIIFIITRGRYGNLGAQRSPVCLDEEAG
jgi:hypothetical protein